MDKSIREFYEEVMMGDIIADYLSEGINDTAIFKAVFLAGGPGSGKSFIGTEKSSASKTLSPSVGGDPRIFMGGGQLGLINIGMRVVNPDPAYEKLLKAAGLDPKNSADIWSDKGQEIRVKATEITAKQKSLYVDGRLGVIIDGTGSNVSKVQGQKALLDKVGYECAMIYVNTDLQTAIDRDQNRSRTIGADKVSEMWNNVQKNLKKYESIFGKSNMYVIDNSNGADWHSGCKVVHKKLEKWIRRAPTDPKAKGWIESQKMRNMPKGGIRESVDEGFLDTFLGRNMKKGNVDKKKSKKSKNSEQVKLSTEIDRKLRLIDDLMKKVRPLGGNLGRLMAFRKLPIDKMTPKGMYVALNDWWDSIEADLDDDSEDDNEKYAQSAEKLYDLWEEVGFKLSDYMWASGYNVKGIGQMAKIGFPAKKRTDPEWLKMNESVDEGFMDTMKQLVPGARNPQKPQEGKKTAMQMQFPYARLSVHRMIVALRKARGTAMKGKAQGKDRRENERSLGYILAHVEDIARTRHAEQPNSGRQIHDTRNIDDQTQSYFMDKIRQNDWTKADQEILNAMVGNGTDDYTKGGAYHARTLAHDIALSVKYAKKDAGINESVDLDENFIAFDYDHEVLTHFQTKADGMKWKNHKNAPDSYYLVKTKHRLLKGDMASDGSDSLSKHLDSQPFPEKDGANFSVHKESVDLDESVYDKKLMQSWKKVKSLPNVRGISNSGQSHAKKLSSLLKGSPDKLTFEKLELALGNYETHAYKAAEDKKNPHGKEDLVKLEEFSNSVDDVIGAMKNLHQSQLPEGFMDTMKQLVPGAKGKPAKGEPAKKLNAEQVKISKQIDKKLKLIDNLVQKVRPLGGQISGLVRFSRLPLEKMNPKDLYRVLNDWYDSIEHELDYGDDSVVLSKKYGRSVENLHERMEELALKIKDYMYASGYDVPHGGAKFQYKWLNKVDFSAPKRTDAKWLKMNESVDEALNMHELR